LDARRRQWLPEAKKADPMREYAGRPLLDTVLAGGTVIPKAQLIHLSRGATATLNITSQLIDFP
jgi:hypothetical protein